MVGTFTKVNTLPKNNQKKRKKCTPLWNISAQFLGSSRWFLWCVYLFLWKNHPTNLISESRMALPRRKAVINWCCWWMVAAICVRLCGWGITSEMVVLSDENGRTELVFLKILLTGTNCYAFGKTKYIVPNVQRHILFWGCPQMFTSYGDTAKIGRNATAAQDVLLSQCRGMWTKINALPWRGVTLTDKPLKL